MERVGRATKAQMNKENRGSFVTGQPTLMETPMNE
jgi:hypothetical protein